MSQQRCEIQIGQAKQFGADGDLSRLIGQPYSTVQEPTGERWWSYSWAQVLYQQTTCEGWSSTNCKLHWMIHCTHCVSVYCQISSCKLSFAFIFFFESNTSSWLAPYELKKSKAAWMLFRLHHERRTRAINKIKTKIYHWQGKMKQQEQNSYCFLSQPQLCAHTLLAHCHLSLSQALASSPTAPTRPGQHMPLPNIHLLPAGLPWIWSGPVIET